MRAKEEQYGVLSHLCSLLFSALRYPLSTSSAERSERPMIPAAWGKLPPISLAGMASLFLGISLTLMLCGSVTFFIGFMMMPWVLCMVILLYFFGIISCIPGLCRAVLINHSAYPAPVKTGQNEIDAVLVLVWLRRFC